MVDSAPQPLQPAVADEAARWLAESFDGRLSPERQKELDAWLAADPRHSQAFAEMQDIWAHMDGVADTPALRAGLAPAVSSRRGFRAVRPSRHRAPRWMAPAIAASLALVIVGAAEDWPTRLRANALTATGERRTVPLPDGSSILLDTHSAVSFDFNGDHRLVRLLEGEAAFRVAPDPARPFTVEAGNGSTTALGTKFLVRRNGDETRVVVTEHRVRIAYPASDGIVTLLDQGNGLTYGPTQGIGPATAMDSSDAMAWTEGVLVFKDTPLADVVAEIGRYYRGYVRVTGDARALRVSGVFHTDDPVASLDQLQRSLGLRSTRVMGRIIFIYS